MTPERWQMVRGILQSAMELRPAERDAFLDRECGMNVITPGGQSLLILVALGCFDSYKIIDILKVFISQFPAPGQSWILAPHDSKGRISKMDKSGGQVNLRAPHCIPRFVESFRLVFRIGRRQVKFHNGRITLRRTNTSATKAAGNAF